MTIYAVIDTNVLVSAMLSKNAEAATRRVAKAMINGAFKILYHKDILDEYREVLSRSKFHFPLDRINGILDFIEREGIPSSRVQNSEFFPDPKDVVFYEVALSKEEAYLVTGNKKHFPQKPIVVTPAEMMDILKKRIVLNEL